MLRPDCLPAVTSRRERVLVERGNILYSAVTQPLPLPFKNGGTRSSTLAVQMTLVLPKLTNTEPSAWQVKCLVKLTGLSSLFARWLGRINALSLFMKSNVRRG